MLVARDRMDAAHVLYERDALDGFLPGRVARRLGVPWVLECNGTFWRPGQEIHPGVPVSARYRRRHIRKLRRADRIITVSAAFRDEIAAQGVDRAKISVIHNAVDPAPYDALERAAVKALRDRLGLGDRTVIGFLGAIRPWHRIDLFLDAIARLRGEGVDAVGLVVGGGRWAEWRERAAGMDGVEVVWTGSVSPEEVPVHVAAMDVCALPGIYEPGSPVKLFDYGAAAKPVVAVDSPSIRELIRHGENGLVFEAGSDADLTRRIRQVIDDPTLGERLGSELRAQVEREHTWDRVAEKTERVLREAIACAS
jgi:glycosyltransferase involved in cell wall biosynthesis